MKIPNNAIRTIVERPGLLKVSHPETHRITCPHCRVGYALVRVDKHGIGKDQEVKVPGIHQPHKCEVCGKWMRLRMQLKIVAYQLTEGNPS